MTLSTGRPESVADLAKIKNAAKGSGKNTVQVNDERLQIHLYGFIGDFPDWYSDEGDYGPSNLAADLSEYPNLPVDLFLNSPGGLLFDGLAMMGQLQRHGEEVTATVDGISASAATLVAMGAGEIYAAHTAATVLIHRGWNIGIGNAVDFQAMAEDMDATDRELAALYASHGGQHDADYYLDLMTQDRRLTAAQAIEHGLLAGIRGEETAADDTDEMNALLLAADFLTRKADATARS